jgi:hypothetical protein
MRKVTGQDDSSLHSTLLDSDAAERIRARAYEIYLQRGDSAGSAEDDWLKAEQEILGNIGRRSAAA